MKDKKVKKLKARFFISMSILFIGLFLGLIGWSFGLILIGYGLGKLDSIYE